MGWPTKTGLPYMCLQFIRDDGASDSVTSDFRSVALSRYGGARSIACDVRQAKRISTMTLFTCADASQHKRGIAPFSAAPAAPFATLHPTRHVVSADVERLRALYSTVHTSSLRSEEEGRISHGCLA